MKLRAALRSTQDLYVHAPATSPTQRQMLTSAGDLEIGARGTGNKHRGATCGCVFVGQMRAISGCEWLGGFYDAYKTRITRPMELALPIHHR